MQICNAISIILFLSKRFGFLFWYSTLTLYIHVGVHNLYGLQDGRCINKYLMKISK